MRAAVVGFGSIGKNHARILSTLEGIQLVGVVDTNPKLFTDSSIKFFNSISELIEQEIDYCVVSVPTIEHESVSLELIEAGIHVLIEKPISHDLESAERIRSAARRKKVLVAVGHVERFNSALQEAKGRIEAGQLGTIYQISTRRLGPFPQRISDVGVIRDLATHDIDLTSWLTNKRYLTLNAFAAFRSGRDLEDLVAITGLLETGVVVNHLVNWLSPFKERSVVVTGELGAFHVDTLSSELTFYENGKYAVPENELVQFHGVSQGDIHNYEFAKPEPLLVEHQSFRDTIIGKPSTIVTLDEGIETLRVALTATESYLSQNTKHL